MPRSPFPRYLVSFETRELPTFFTDVLVIGTGVAGLRAAISAAEHVRVVILTKEKITDSNTQMAQGGIASAIGPGDSALAHRQDTLRAGQGLTDQATVTRVIREGKHRVVELGRWGARFDHKAGRVHLTREGGHSRARIVHAGGDATGAEVVRALLDRLRQSARVQLHENAFTIDLVGDGLEISGVLFHEPGRGLALYRAGVVILATGGTGQVYRETTNAEIATGDGLAMAYRAGALLEDMEFVQFHPTTLYVPGAKRVLITEAVRGEGGLLRDREGKRFMTEFHPLGDLAPRDVVSRGILRRMATTGEPHVYLDVRHISSRKLCARFPGLWELCESFGIDLSRDLVPVRPSAHYLVGGIRIDRDGRTSLRNLFACGEVACARFHGANRLASNSLLEGLVFGHRAGTAAARASRRARVLSAGELHSSEPRGSPKFIDVTDVSNSLKSLMTRSVGVEREGRELEEALERIRYWSSYVIDKQFHQPDGWEMQNLLTVATMIASSALARRESRGVHFRLDFPDRDDRRWRRHLTVRRNG